MHQCAAQQFVQSGEAVHPDGLVQFGHDVDADDLAALRVVPAVHPLYVYVFLDVAEFEQFPEQSAREGDGGGVLGLHLGDGDGGGLVGLDVGEDERQEGGGLQVGVVAHHAGHFFLPDLEAVEADEVLDVLEGLLELLELVCQAVQATHEGVDAAFFEGHVRVQDLRNLIDQLAADALFQELLGVDLD